MDLPAFHRLALVMLGESSLGATFDHVGIDNVAAATVAVEHLLDQGRRRIAAVGLTDRPPAAAPRHEGYLAAHRARGTEPLPAVRVEDWRMPSGAAAVEEVLRMRDRSGRAPDAIFAFNDTLALGALRGLQRLGVLVPDDIAVIGMDDISEAAYATPTLSSVATDLDALAEEALSLLERQLAEGADRGRRRPLHVDVPFTLIPRESSVGPPRSTARDRGRRRRSRVPTS